MYVRVKFKLKKRKVILAMAKEKIVGSYELKLKHWTIQFSKKISDVFENYAPLRGNIKSYDEDIMMVLLCSNIDGNFKKIEIIYNPCTGVMNCSKTFFDGIGTLRMTKANKDSFLAKNKKAFALVKQYIDEYINMISGYPHPISSVFFDLDIETIKTCLREEDSKEPGSEILYLIGLSAEYLEDIVMVDATRALGATNAVMATNWSE